MRKTFFCRNTDVFQGKMTRRTAKRPAVRVRWEFSDTPYAEPKNFRNPVGADAAFRPEEVSNSLRSSVKIGFFCGRTEPSAPTNLPEGRIHTCRQKIPLLCGRGIFAYFAYSTALVSRMTLTLICPGYSSSDSIFLARSCASRTMLSSLTSSGLTMMRTSRPA